MKLFTKIKTAFSLDLRALALSRIGIGIAMCCDILDRWAALTLHYTSEGVTPAAVALKINSLWQNGSPYFLIENVPTMHLVFTLHFIVGGLLALGWKTRLITPVAWALTVFLNMRNPALEYGFDQFLMIYLFLGMFLPWGLRYSIERVNQPAEDKVASFGSAALLIQVVIIYVSSSLSKMAEPAWQDGAAVYYVVKILPTYFSNYADILAPFSPLAGYFVIGVQLSTLLLFLPIPTLRRIIVLVMVLIHFGIALFLDFPLFSWIAISVLAALYPFETNSDRLLPQSPGVQLVPLLFILILVTHTSTQWAKGPSKIHPNNWTYRFLDTVKLKQVWMFFVNISPKRRHFQVLLYNKVNGESKEVITPNMYTRTLHLGPKSQIRWHLMFEIIRSIDHFRGSFGKAVCSQYQNPSESSTVEFIFKTWDITEPNPDWEVQSIFEYDCTSNRLKNI